MVPRPLHGNGDAPVSAVLSIDDDNHWEVISTAAAGVSFIPTADDVDKYLRVVATYDDSTLSAGNSNTVRAVTRYKVRAAPIANSSPDFPAVLHTRSVLETAAVGDPVGTVVTAGEPDSADQGKLIYGLIVDSVNPDDIDYFSIDQYTGQIRVKASLDADQRWDTAESTFDPANPVNRITGTGDEALGNGEYRVTVTVSDPSVAVNQPPGYRCGDHHGHAAERKPDDYGTDPVHH